MKLSLRCEYALLALVCVARDGSSTQETIRDIRRVPEGLLTEVMSALVEANYLRQTSDGFRLAKRPARISVAEIIRLFDGALAPMEPISQKGYGLSPMEQESSLAGLFASIEIEIANRLEATSLADLC